MIASAHIIASPATHLTLSFSGFEAIISLVNSVQIDMSVLCEANNAYMGFTIIIIVVVLILVGVSKSSGSFGSLVHRY